jgi:hypothetical protein
MPHMIAQTPSDDAATKQTEGIIRHPPCDQTAHLRHSLIGFETISSGVNHRFSNPTRLRVARQPPDGWR